MLSISSGLEGGLAIRLEKNRRLLGMAYGIGPRRTGLPSGQKGIERLPKEEERR